MQVIGYVYSKKEKRLVAIERDITVETKLDEKVFTYLKEQLKNKFLKGEESNVPNTSTRRKNNTL